MAHPRLLNGLAALALTSVAVLNTGCAFGTRHVNLPYTGAVTAPVAQTGKTVSFGEFTDDLEHNKKDQATIGCVRNLYGMRTASVVAENSPADWFKGALECELSSAGFSIANSGDPRIEGKLIRLYTDIYMNYTTNVAFTLKLREGEKTFFTDVFASATSVPAGFVTANEYGRASEYGMQQAMKTAVPKIRDELNRFYQRKNEETK